MMDTESVPQKDAVEENLYLQSDLLVLTGDIYIRTKALFLDIAQEEDLPNLFKKIIHEIQQAPDSIFQIMLALAVWTSHGSAPHQLRKASYQYITGRLQSHLAGKASQYFLSNLAQQKYEFQIKELSPQMAYKVTELVNLIGAVVLSNNVGVLENLADLVNKPENYIDLFLPTMPASNFFEVRDVLKLERAHNTSPKAYLCPEGHVYFIGECTNPVQEGKCPECGNKIGGQKYGLLHAGNTAGELTEASQAGYLLKDAAQCQLPTQERKLTKLSVCALRACLHSCMLLANKEKDTIQRMVKVKSKEEAQDFLVQHVYNDMRNLATCLGRSIDDAFIMMHQIVHKFRTYNAGNQILSLRTMAARTQWEEAFQRQFFSLAFQNTDALINAAQAVIVQVGDFAQRPLEKIVYELNLNGDIEDGVIPWNSPSLWNYRIHADMLNVRQKLEAVDETVGGEGSILKVLLNVEHLDLLRFLCEILKVQDMFISRYRQKVDLGDTEKLTLQDFIEDNESYIEDQIEQYISIWNKLRKDLEKVDRFKMPKPFFESDMNMDSPISMCLPSKHGRGRCALLLVEYFITMQNTLLLKCRDLITPPPSFPVVDVRMNMENDLICIMESHDLMPLVIANSQYEYSKDESGTKHNIAYNFGSLEKKVKEKFILRKSLLKIETIPQMVYPQDVGLKNEVEKVNEKTTQVPLPQRLIQDLDTNVENARTADICEAVRTITLAISFIAKLGGEAEQAICDYVEKDILLSPEETVLIPRTAQICHTIALYERLSWHRSVRFVLNGDNPFEKTIGSESMKDIEDEELLHELERSLINMNIARLQIELNSLLMCGPDMTPDWGLGETLKPYLEGKYDDVDVGWCDHIPADIMCQHSAHVFRITVRM
ncbi:E3 ubiquitin-protein ligase rnf213-alpha-like [Ciona intestinalis]